MKFRIHIYTWWQCNTVFIWGAHHLYLFYSTTRKISDTLSPTSKTFNSNSTKCTQVIEIHNSFSSFENNVYNIYTSFSGLRKKSRIYGQRLLNIHFNDLKKLLIYEYSQLTKLALCFCCITFGHQCICYVKTWNKSKVDLPN